MTNVNGVYTVSLPTTLAVGSHPVIWTVVGKNPDGTAEAPQTALQSVSIADIGLNNTIPTQNTTVSDNS